VEGRLTGEKSGASDGNCEIISGLILVVQTTSYRSVSASRSDETTPWSFHPVTTKAIRSLENSHVPKELSLRDLSKLVLDADGYYLLKSSIRKTAQHHVAAAKPRAKVVQFDRVFSRVLRLNVKPLSGRTYER
jgi:hypothetical protein